MPSIIVRSLSIAIVATIVATAPVAANSGWLDKTFSDNGYVRLDPPAGSEPFIPATPIIRDGPTGRVFLGRHRLQPGSAFSLLALTSTGAIDRGFNAGEWRERIGSKDALRILGMFPTADGGVQAAAWAGAVGSDLHVFRLGPGGGDVDSFFGRTGGEQIATTMVVLPGGSLRTCVWTETISTLLIGLTATLDPDGGVWGQELEIGGCDHIAADSTGHLYHFDERTTDRLNFSRLLIEVIRTSNSGRTDAAWASSGRAILERGGLHVAFPFAGVQQRPGYGAGNPAVFPQPDGSLLIAARVARFDPGGPWSAAVLKVTPNGELDPTFGTGGIKTMSPPDGQSRLLAMTVDGTGRPIVSLVYNHNDGRTRAYLARLTTAGTFDTTFGRNGLVPQTHAALSLDMDGAGRILSMAWDGQSLIVARRTN